LIENDTFIPRVKLVLPPNQTITCVKEACQELRIGRDYFYALRRRKEVPKVRGFRFYTTRRKLWEWFESLVETDQ
jgi:hypothetical protein